MASKLVLLKSLIISFLFYPSKLTGFTVTEARVVPAMYVFGYSLVDVGNNNYPQFSFAKANFPHNGLDFPTKQPTGGFCNGKNAADLLAEKMGLPTLPPYLSMAPKLNKSYTLFLNGVNFASGAKDTDQHRLYDYGARKFVFVGIGLIGCTPLERNERTDQECKADINQLSAKYNQVLISMLKNLKSELRGLNYSYFDGYSLMYNFIQNPTAYGFAEVKAACCGLGKLNADATCLPFATYCTNRSNHLFWDRTHPTEEAHRIFVDYIISGPLQYTFPINVKKLVSI